jgi:membrane protein implicated in regulation of membrane protease activity
MSDTEQAVIVWVVVAVLAVATEMFTMAFVAIYLGLGAAAAAIAAWMDYSTGVQLAVFGIVGIALLLITRPFLAKKIQQPDVRTNVHALVGRRAIVTITVDDDANTGQIRVGTEYWTARHAVGNDSEAIPVDAKVEVVAVEGVTARVVPVLE